MLSELKLFSRTQVDIITIEMRNLLAQLNNHILSQQATPRGLGTHWQQEPMTLEDALGVQIPIPLELVTSWDVSDCFLLNSGTSGSD